MHYYELPYAGEAWVITNTFMKSYSKDNISLLCNSLRIIVLRRTSRHTSHFWNTFKNSGQNWDKATWIKTDSSIKSWNEHFVHNETTDNLEAPASSATSASDNRTNVELWPFQQGCHAEVIFHESSDKLANFGVSDEIHLLKTDYCRNWIRKTDFIAYVIFCEQVLDFSDISIA